MVFRGVKDLAIIGHLYGKMYQRFTRIHSEFIAICYLSRMMIKNGGLECGWCRLCVGQWVSLSTTWKGTST
jgi:hypothetical protein